jgi:L-aspartate oxidase
VQQAGLEPVLDAREAVGESFPRRFPTVFGYAQEAGIDPRVEVMPVSPAVHYYMGGVDVDEDGRTSLDGLWAVGEVTSSGVHGANRLASNSLLEGLVFGRRVGEDISKSASRLEQTVAFEVPLAGVQPYAKSDEALVQDLRQMMWDNVGVERDGDRLRDARDRLRTVLADAGRTRVRNLALVGMLVAQAALDREESRGGHYRLDFPETKPDWAERTLLTRAAEPGVTFIAEADDVLPGARGPLLRSNSGAA